MYGFSHINPYEARKMRASYSEYRFTYELLAKNLVDGDLTATLDRIRSDSLQLILRAIHIRCCGHVSLQMDCIEVTLRGAETTSNTTVLVNYRSTTAKASLRFRLDLFFSEYFGEIIEGVLCNASLLARDLTRSVIESFNLDIILIQYNKLTTISCEVKSVTGMYKTVNGNCTFTAACDCIDGKTSAGEYITTYEDIRLSGLSGQRICLSSTVTVDDNLGAL